MNSDIQSVNASKYEKLKKESNNAQIYSHNNRDDFQVIHGIPHAYQIFDNVSSSEQKQKPNFNLTPTSYTSSMKNIDLTAGKHQMHKLVDSKQVSGSIHQSDKRTFLLDTYARIAASNNRRCPKRLRELAKPKRQAHSDQNDYSANFNLHYGRANKTYGTDNKCSLKESKKK